MNIEKLDSLQERISTMIMSLSEYVGKNDCLEVVKRCFYEFKKEYQQNEKTVDNGSNIDESVQIELSAKEFSYTPLPAFDSIKNGNIKKSKERENNVPHDVNEITNDEKIIQINGSMPDIVLHHNQMYVAMPSSLQEICKKGTESDEKLIEYADQEVMDMPRKRIYGTKTTDENYKRRCRIENCSTMQATKLTPFDLPVNPEIEKAKENRRLGRRKTISHELKIDMDVLVPKNTYQIIHRNNSFYETWCVLCYQNYKNLVPHYKDKHPGHEVYISRPSPTAANRLRLQEEKFEVYGNKKIKGWCFFCEENHTKPKFEWGCHYLLHTGEPKYACDLCEFKSETLKDHKTCPEKLVSVFEPNSSDGSLMAFICIRCNYMQFNSDRMVKHMVNEHGYEEAVAHQHFEKVMLIPNYLPAKSNIEFNYEKAAKVFQCTICCGKYENANQFEEHFDEKHAQVDRYECFCSFEIALDDCSLSGFYVVAHLNMHSAADVYECPVCKYIFFEEADVQIHLYEAHAGCEFRYYHEYREAGKNAIVTETMTTKMVCTVCQEKVDTFKCAFKHFRREHDKSETSKLIIFTSRKTSQPAKISVGIETTISTGISFNVNGPIPSKTHN